MLITSLLPLATVVTPNLAEARVLAGGDGDRRTLAERIVARGARAVLITGGEGEGSDLLFDGTDHVEIPVDMGGRDRHARHRLHALGDARRGARRGERRSPMPPVAPRRSRRRPSTHGLVEIGKGAGPVAVGQASGASQRVRTR